MKVEQLIRKARGNSKNEHGLTSSFANQCEIAKEKQMKMTFPV